jgi:hypothetical protein
MDKTVVRMSIKLDFDFDKDELEKMTEQKAEEKVYSKISSFFLGNPAIVGKLIYKQLISDWKTGLQFKKR